MVRGKAKDSSFSLASLSPIMFVLDIAVDCLAHTIFVVFPRGEIEAEPTGITKRQH